MSDSYVNFDPYVPGIRPIQDNAYTDATDSGGARDTKVNVVIPVAMQVLLSGLPVSGVQDYFFWLPYRLGSVQAVYVGTAEAVDLPAGTSFQLIQRNGNVVTELTEQKRVSSLGIVPTELPSPGTVIGAPVFVRIRSTAASIVLLFTAHLLTSEVA